jgi:3-isopropylmalate dehydratase small subunit
VISRLTALGVRVIVALGFEARFYEKCVGQGILPVILERDAFEELEGRVASRPGVATTIDLEAQVIERPDMEAVPFGVDPRARNKLLLGLTDLDEALRYRKEGAALRDEDRLRRPWLYGKA